MRCTVSIVFVWVFFFFFFFAVDYTLTAPEEPTRVGRQPATAGR